jgi:hypothetical protein
MAKKRATSNLVFQVFVRFIGTLKKSILVRAFLENPLFKLFPALIPDVADPGTC